MCATPAEQPRDVANRPKKLPLLYRIDDDEPSVVFSHTSVHFFFPLVVLYVVSPPPAPYQRPIDLILVVGMRYDCVIIYGECEVVLSHTFVL